MEVWSENIATLLLLMVLLPFFGAVADRTSAFKVMMGACAGLALLAGPLSVLMGSGGPAAGVSQAVMAVFVAAFGGPMGTVFASSFHARTRFVLIVYVAPPTARRHTRAHRRVAGLPPQATGGVL